MVSPIPGCLRLFDGTRYLDVPEEGFKRLIQSGYNGQNQNQQYTAMNPYTNKIFVTSLEDALNRQSPYNSIMTYINQDKPEMYEIVTDGSGRKTSQIFDCSLRPDPQERTEQQIDKIVSILQGLDARLKKLEEGDSHESDEQKPVDATAN